ncbi:DUF167 domain-containing protein [Allopontixanthobacter sp.]|uniref:DUF167 domain-containing protein n=1 Tax=Allopontixanthobacter sp. TaxID=2906452 RepID=UPI002ABC4775|nr:DUF167 domain-containing protein [Allopontixanthobacter sp.]MDZ4308454.1 DUF167 domain-containing protein [Allopontixanthobacter sp.]
MARPKADLPPADAIRVLADAQGRLAVRVTPGARSEGISIEGLRVMVKVRAVPDGGAANDAVLKLLAKALGLPPSRLRLLRGATSREKVFQVEP